MVEHARSSPRRQFVVATETGVLHRLRREAPDADKRFHAVSERAICRHMKRITLPKVLRALRDDVHPVTVAEPVAGRARRALERMVGLG
jgi:quinolinate synthase